MTHDSRKIALLVLSALPLLGSTCTKEKTIEFVVTGESYASFEARGADDFGSDEFDLATDLDIASIAESYDVDIQTIQRVTFRGLCYKITRADPNPDRRIENGLLEIQFRNFAGDTGSYPLAPLSTSFGTAPGDPGAPRSAGSPTDWIDVTELVDAAGVEQINQFLDRYLTALKNGTVASGAWVFYHWTGASVPLGNTDFDWQVKVQVNIIPTVTAELPDF